MPRKALRHVIKKDQQSQKILDGLCDVLAINIYVISEDGKITYGQDGPTLTKEFKIIVNGDSVATVRSDDDKGEKMADLISLLLHKELDKKKIGSEVLGLYREINMIYSFSEKISEKIDSSSIAEIALKEASQIIDCTSGSFLMYDPARDRVIQAGAFGQEVGEQSDVDKYTQLIRLLIEKGTSAIVPADSLKDFAELSELRSLMYAPLKVKHRILGLIMLGHSSEKEFTAAELKLLTTIALQSASAIESAHLYEKGIQEAQDREDAIRKIHEVSSKFVPFEFIRSLGKNNLTEVSLGDQVEREVTVLFADIRDFTSLSETMPPEQNFLFVNGFNERMGPIIREHGGFINQYLGDGFMALFPGGSLDALRASVAMHRALEIYNQQRKEKDRGPIRIGIGMQSGKLIMGITGDVERMDAATISDTVNTAARVESLSKHYGTSILLTDDCKQQLPDNHEFDFRYLGLVQVKGRKKPLRLFECINGDAKALYKHKMDTLPLFNEAMDQYFDREFAMAAVAFQQIVKKHVNDKTAKLLLNRSAHLITQEIAEDWKGVESIH